MTLPSNENLKAKIPITDHNLKQKMEKLKASLRQAYKEVTVANRQAHQTNKRYYNRRENGFICTTLLENQAYHESFLSPGPDPSRLLLRCQN